MNSSVWKRNAAYALSLVPGAFVLGGLCIGGLATWGNVVFSLGFLAVLESILPDNTRTDHSEFRDWMPRFWLWAHVALTLAMLLALFEYLDRHAWASFSGIGAVVSCGIACGSGAVVVGHELIHKANPIEKGAGRLLLLLCGNPYFSAHHILVHHTHVGTDSDCVTAKKGESVYRYIPRSIGGQFVQAWQVETAMQQKKGERVRLWRSHLAQNCFILVLGALLLAWVSIDGLMAWVGVSLIAALLLEYVNYIEHYGLQRQPGERVGPSHSWNSNRTISRFLLFDLSRHADHHMHASKPYHCLDSGLDSPRLPGGYVQLLYLAFRPQKWFSTVDPLLPSNPQ